MLGTAPIPGYWDAQVCDFHFKVSDAVVAKSAGPIRLRGAHLVSDQETFQTVTHPGRLFVSPDPVGEKMTGEEKGVTIKSKAPTGLYPVSDHLKVSAPKQPRPVGVSGVEPIPSLDRCDLNFDGVVSAIDLAIFLEFLSRE